MRAVRAPPPEALGAEPREPVGNHAPIGLPDNRSASGQPIRGEGHGSGAFGVGLESHNSRTLGTRTASRPASAARRLLAPRAPQCAVGAPAARPRKTSGGRGKAEGKWELNGGGEEPKVFVPAARGLCGWLEGDIGNFRRGKTKSLTQSLGLNAQDVRQGPHGEPGAFSRVSPRDPGSPLPSEPTCISVRVWASRTPAGCLCEPRTMLAAVPNLWPGAKWPLGWTV
ncbi:uncharacterized protein LOC104851506 [Fukomys damarensis]|uniref:uncharacterized protein LOC104851506 n=1 Tax=Fukomys damarensis TaxID=885580 RepID=UPI00053F457F|nr:uncharacterized protein LOC104851506 [Fukomys damarensis]